MLPLWNTPRKIWIWLLNRTLFLFNAKVSKRQTKGMERGRLAFIDGGEVGRSAMLVQWLEVVVG